MGKLSNLILSSILLLYSSIAFSGPIYTLDVYKSSQITTEKIQKKYDQYFSAIAEILVSEDSLTTNKNISLVNMYNKKIVSGIKNMGKFYYLKIVYTFYKRKNIVHFTINVVDKKDNNCLSHKKIKLHHSYTV